MFILINLNSKWEKEHEEKLLAKSKEESERHQKAIAQAKEDTDKFFEERKERCEAKRRQNAEEEEVRREALKKVLEEGDPWIQSAKLIDYQKAAGAKDSSCMRHVLISLKHWKEKRGIDELRTQRIVGRGKKMLANRICVKGQ